VSSSDGIRESAAYSIRIRQQFLDGAEGLKNALGELSFESPSELLVNRLDPFFGDSAEIYLEDESSKWRRVRIEILEVSSGRARFRVIKPGRAFD
jgi:hypothetical protein